MEKKDKGEEYLNHRFFTDHPDELDKLEKEIYEIRKDVEEKEKARRAVVMAQIADKVVVEVQEVDYRGGFDVFWEPIGGLRVIRLVAKLDNPTPEEEEVVRYRGDRFPLHSVQYVVYNRMIVGSSGGGWVMIDKENREPNTKMGIVSAEKIADALSKAGIVIRRKHTEPQVFNCRVCGKRVEVHGFTTVESVCNECSDKGLA